MGCNPWNDLSIGPGLPNGVSFFFVVRSLSPPFLGSSAFSLVPPRLLSSLSLLFGVLPGFSGPRPKAFATALAQGLPDQSEVCERNKGAIEIAYLE